MNVLKTFGHTKGLARPDVHKRLALLSHAFLGTRQRGDEAFRSDPVAARVISSQDWCGQV